jgi:ATP-binding cassette subfamily B protein
MVLRNVSFKVPANTTTAIVGATGSGKSTIARLVFRLYDPMEGTVRIAGQDVRSVLQHSVRRTVGMVPQDTSLFNDSLAFNVGYGRIGCELRDIEDASEAAQLASFIATLPKGYDTVVGERGLKLSGGERQRVAIARAMLKDPPVLILDEASSALDSITEARVQEAIERASGGRTVLVIAHRLSTIRNADQIIVLEHGEIVERGSFADLIAAEGGRFRELWEQQARVEARGAQE